ncbi:L-asparaginase [Schizosaccharomyces japonicus yFS275]|uniref:L-asparaginase n=1 Tax=Schizosaccharomyces japonicus (strain yFS275 / FY16936) TaxID=402676 RepID=B6K8A8_SCHJY|nr:L-asparaginase [Schizosaccharomyces japonicus yFS275]EEB09762.2 L-asparaginase [Schizosaccharomyces japonicus yFS275]
MSSEFIIVHAGAGAYSNKKRTQATTAIRLACQIAVEALKNGCDCMEAVVKAIMSMEDNPHTNCGTGSNLNQHGYVSCDAGLMRSTDNLCASIGDCRVAKNPIQICEKLLLSQHKLSPLGLQPPCFLVHDGVKDFMEQHALPTYPPEKLITETSLRTYRHWKERRVEIEKHMFSDTVGAICIDRYGNMAIACSSGGNILKHQGRIGPSALPGCGFWIEGSSDKSMCASTVTGSGELIIRTQFASSVCQSLLDSSEEWSSLKELTRNVQHHHTNKYVADPMVGSIFTKLERLGKANVLVTFGYAHTSPGMVLGYMKGNSSKATVITSELNNLDTVTNVFAFKANSG